MTPSELCLNALKASDCDHVPPYLGIEKCRPLRISTAIDLREERMAPGIAQHLRIPTGEAKTPRMRVITPAADLASRFNQCVLPLPRSRVGPEVR